MPHYSNIHRHLAFVNAVNYTILTDAYPPEVLMSTELFTAGWSGVNSQLLYLIKDAFGNRLSKRLKLTASRTRKDYGILRHRLPAEDFLFDFF